MNFTPSLPALAGIQSSQVKVGMATSTTAHLGKNLVLENPDQQHLEALTLFCQTYTVRKICAIVPWFDLLKSIAALASIC